jgi:hypothetical protein
VGWGNYIDTCYNTGAVTGGYSVGGVAGTVSSSVTNCYNTGAVRGTNDYVGGVAGENYGATSACYNIGVVSGTSKVGGVAGSNAATITVTDCYWKEGTATLAVGDGDPMVGGASFTGDTFDPPPDMIPGTYPEWGTGSGVANEYWRDYEGPNANGGDFPALWWE